MQNSQGFSKQKFIFANSSGLRTLKELNHAAPVLCTYRDEPYFLAAHSILFLHDQAQDASAKGFSTMSIFVARQGLLKVASNQDFVQGLQWNAVSILHALHDILGLF